MKKNQINSRQLGVLIFISFLTMKFINLPSLIYQRNFELSLAIYLFLILLDGLIFFIVLNFINKHPGISFFEYLSSKIGKILSKIVYFALFSYFLLRFVIFLGGNFAFLRDVIFSASGLVFYLATLLPVLCALTFSPLKAFARTCELFFKIMLVGLVICLILGFFFGGFEMPYISFDTTLANFFNEAVNFNFWFGDALFMLLFMENIKVDKTFKTKTYGFLILAMVVLITFMICFFGVFPFTAYNHTYAIYEMSIFTPHIISSGGLNIFPVVTMMFFIILQAAKLFRCATKCCDEIFVAKNNKRIFTIALCAVVTVMLLIFVFPNDQSLFDFTSGWFRWFTLANAFVLPLLLVFTFFKRGEKK